ncbi:MAG: hypothetical protein GY950_37280 [bacterium]|nr:hypothetical protein [bacterium]
MQRLYTADFPPGDFLAVLKQFQLAAESLLLAFSPAEFKFERFVLNESFLAAADQGRIFSPEGELKWRRVGNNMRLVYLGNPVHAEGFTDYSAQLEPLKPDQYELILWGIRTDTKNEWIEQQVPHRFDYPVTGKPISRGRVALVVERWLDSGGLPRFSRYHHIKEIKGEK